MAEENLIKHSKTIEELDAFLSELQANVIVGTVVLFEIPKHSKIVFNPGTSMILVILEVLIIQKVSFYYRSTYVGFSSYIILLSSDKQS